MIAGSNFCTECGAKIEDSGKKNITASNEKTDNSSVRLQQEIEHSYKRGKECLDGGVMGNAFEYFKKAAEQGHVDAQYQLAKMYQDGKVEIELPKSRKDIDDHAAAAARSESVREKYATKWYGKAAKQGHAEAQYELAMQYLTGKVGGPSKEGLGATEADVSVEKSNFEIAVQWLTLSAEQNIDAAMYKLGEIYDIGNNLPQDIAKARELYSKAAAKGNRDAIVALAALEFRMQVDAIDCEEDRDEFMRAMAEFCKKMKALLEEEQVNILSVYSFDSPQFGKKLKGALAYSALQKEEIPLLIQDVTLMGSAKEGVLFTTRAIYSKRKLYVQRRVAYQKVESVSVELSGRYHIMVDDSEIGFGFAKLQDAKLVLLIVKSLIGVLKRQKKAAF